LECGELATPCEEPLQGGALMRWRDKAGLGGMAKRLIRSCKEGGLSSGFGTSRFPPSESEGRASVPLYSLHTSA